MRLKLYSRIRWALLALTLAAFLLRLYHLQFQSLWRDEVDAILFATQDWSSLVGMFTHPGENGPLYFLLLRPWVALSGDSEFATRFFSLIFGTLSVPLTYRLGRRFVSTTTSFWGAVLVASSPYLIWYAQETKMYALMVCLSLVSTLFLVGALQGRRNLYWIGYVITTSLSFYTHILAVALLPFHVLIFAAGGRRYWARWRGALISFALLTVPYIPLARWEVPTLLSPFTTGHPFYSLDAILAILFKVQSFGVREPSLVEISLFLFLLLIGIFLYKKDDGRPHSLNSYPQTIFLLYFLIPVLTVFLISLGMPIFTDRYLIGIVPAFCLLLACGLEALRMRSQVIFALCLAGALFINGQGIWIQSQTPIKANFRDAAAYYGAHASPDDLLVFQMPYVHRNFEYYYRRPYHRADGLYTNDGLTAEQVSVRMNDLVAEYSTIWLLKSEAETWDERDMVEQWLHTAARLSDEAEFQRVSLERYVRPPES